MSKPSDSKGKSRAAGVDRRSLFLMGGSAVAAAAIVPLTGGEAVAAGNRAFMGDLGWRLSPSLAKRAETLESSAHSVIYVGWGTRVHAVLAFDDTPRSDSRATIEGLRRLQRGQDDGTHQRVVHQHEESLGAPGAARGDDTGGGTRQGRGFHGRSGGLSTPSRGFRCWFTPVLAVHTRVPLGRFTQFARGTGLWPGPGLRCRAAWAWRRAG